MILGELDRRGNRTCLILRAVDHPVPHDHDAAVSGAFLLTDLAVFPSRAVELGKNISSASVGFVDGHDCVAAFSLQLNGLYQTDVGLSLALKGTIVPGLQIPRCETLSFGYRNSGYQADGTARELVTVITQKSGEFPRLFDMDCRCGGLVPHSEKLALSFFANG